MSIVAVVLVCVSCFTISSISLGIVESRLIPVYSENPEIPGRRVGGGTRYTGMVDTGFQVHSM